MNTQHSFVPERVAAQHCQELLRRGPEPADLIPALGRMGERLARTLASAFAELTGGEAPSVSVAAPTELTETELREEVGPLAANCLLATPVPGLSLLASVEGQSTLRLVDRAFGGSGDAQGVLPAAFPLSAELMIQRLETLIARSLGEALGLGELRTGRRDSRLSELAPFPAGARLVVQRIEVMEGARRPWKLLIALPFAQLPKLLGQGDQPAPRSGGSADPAAQPFAEVPLPLTATLVEMRVPLSALAALEPGAVLPVAINRAVPVLAGTTVIARGSVGAQDDRVAIKLTQIA
ncbi:MAG TPA: FliM/FliN family flagellar motor switch protein [Novosphingobium sp.]|nr:FliM/FliN family flagellar motor switch protein [Novosphingobium sp.]HQA17167.1 FliM/FliN family flagellar motor switch protein [Novosphingobium sp.]